MDECYVQGPLSMSVRCGARSSRRFFIQQVRKSLYSNMRRGHNRGGATGFNLVLHSNRFEYGIHAPLRVGNRSMQRAQPVSHAHFQCTKAWRWSGPQPVDESAHNLAAAATWIYPPDYGAHRPRETLDILVSCLGQLDARRGYRESGRTIR